MKHPSELRYIPKISMATDFISPVSVAKHDKRIPQRFIHNKLFGIAAWELLGDFDRVVAEIDPRIKLSVFEGPLDLLLFLIRKHEIDIYDIPIGLVLDQYLDALSEMQEVNLEIAGRFFRDGRYADGNQEPSVAAQATTDVIRRRGR